MQGGQLAQRCMLWALQWMHDRAAERPKERRGEWRKHLNAMQAALRFAHQECPTEASLPESSAQGTIDPMQVKKFGEMVERARMAASLSRSELGKRAGLAEGTVRNTEEGNNIPTQATVQRLLAVSELGLRVEQVPWLRTEGTSFGSSPNCWIAPGYDPLKLFAELFELLNSRGGSVEQTFSYLDHKSATNWYQLSTQSEYASKYRAKTPLEEMARHILSDSMHARFDVIALGSGDGMQEVRLVQHLLDQAEAKQLVRDVRLFLIDISQPLLSVAYQHASMTLGQRDVYICAVQGDFHQWPQYTQFHHTDERSHRRRLVCMFGNTVGNLDNEARFFEHTLVGLGVGDLLLIDFLLAYGNPANPAEIERRDPSLSRPVPQAHVEWLGGPLWRYCKDVVDVTLNYRLDVRCQFPGAYTLDTVAKARLRDGREKSFSVFRFKRYDSQRFADTLRHFGWELVADVPFGPDPAKPVMAALLFRKVSQSRPM